MTSPTLANASTRFFIATASIQQNPQHSTPAGILKVRVLYSFKMVTGQSSIRTASHVAHDTFERIFHKSTTVIRASI